MSGNYKLGIAEGNSKAFYNGGSKHWLALTHNLIGCPEFEMWTAIPAEYSSVTITSSSTTSTVNTRIANSNISVRGLFGGSSYLQTKTGSSVSFTGLPKNYVVTAYKHNYIPYIAPIYAQNESVTGSHYIYASDVYLGSNVTNRIATGNFVIKNKATVTIDSSGDVSLDKGFEVELGGVFEVK